MITSLPSWLCRSSDPSKQVNEQSRIALSSASNLEMQKPLKGERRMIQCKDKELPPSERQKIPDISLSVKQFSLSVRDDYSNRESTKVSMTQKLY